MGGMRSKRKGKVGEREAAAELTRLGIQARRGCQFAGGEDSPDVRAELPGVHFEVKRTEKLTLWSAIDQATRDAGDSVPVVLHRPNRRPWLLVVPLDRLPELATQVYLALASGGEQAEEL